jgi:hypothetical protein
LGVTYFWGVQEVTEGMLNVSIPYKNEFGTILYNDKIVKVENGTWYVRAVEGERMGKELIKQLFFEHENHVHGGKTWSVKESRIHAQLNTIGVFGEIYAWYRSPDNLQLPLNGLKSRNGYAVDLTSTPASFVLYDWCVSRMGTLVDSLYFEFHHQLI